MIVGLVLAGGRSRRFGSDKAAALLEGRPLLHWSLARLDSACAEVAVSAAPGSAAEALAGGRTVLADAATDAAGPLAGVHAGLVWARDWGASHLATAPCDTPRLPADLYPRLAALAGAAPAAARTADGPQPLCALWPVTALEVIAKVLERGVHPPVWRLLDDLGCVWASFDDDDAFANANRQDDLR